MNDFSALIQDTLDHLKSCYRKDDLLFVSDESYLHFFTEPKKIGEAATLKKATPLQAPIAQRPLQRDKPLIKPSPLPSTPSQVVVHQLPRQSPLKHEETFSTAMSSKI
ncbi:MAG: hypothetical protein EBZ47_09420, partial [Chlamydiae bacterium]|nr:hypothetical protein [Chlamydiota bacterium]